ncbi:HAD-IC family P-type ATPase [Actinomadura sp. CNU-125]|uniref:HAD-IC family P-type ATPase n=1 Tax=Actinomadura sp. CNU-125 TaxID=1904961 RepID=UPI000A716AA3|nr:HAD-IC family P-type ATPase [Actinomadura sp. CNU-125]
MCAPSWPGTTSRSALPPACRRTPRIRPPPSSPGSRTPAAPPCWSPATATRPERLGIADRIRADAAATVAALTELTGATPVLLTGDNPRAAAGLAAEAGIDDVRAGLLPQDKVAAVRELEAEGHRVLVVGDGVNDAPALAAAHTGVAMGRAGSDLALETADAIVVRDELAAVPAAVDLSRRARRLVKQNLVIAGTFIAVLVAWDLTGTLPLPLGVAGHEGSTVIVALNGLRLLRSAAWRPVGRAR